MAISRHDPKWQRAVFMALAGGVEFTQTRQGYDNRPGGPYLWFISLPGGDGFYAASKYHGALRALARLGVEVGLLMEL